MYRQVDYCWIIAHATEMPGDPQNWPYTDEFREWVQEYNTTHHKEPLTFQELYNVVLTLRKERFKTTRKESQLPLAVKRRKPEYNRMTEQEKAKLATLYNKHRKETSRDRLPYTKEFTEICEEMSRLFPDREFREREIWTAILQMGKAKLLDTDPDGTRRRGGHKKNCKRKGFGFRERMTKGNSQ